MTQTDIRITELMMRLTALERERAAIIAEIETLRSAPNEEPAANKVIPPEKANQLVDRNSTNESKMALFRRLFRGRPDIFPIRWENRKTGRSGYAPACANEWQRGICEKPKVKCSACPNQAFLAVDDVSMERHLRGTDANGLPFVMGVYWWPAVQQVRARLPPSYISLVAAQGLASLGTTRGCRASDLQQIGESVYMNVMRTNCNRRRQ